MTPAQRSARRATGGIAAWWLLVQATAAPAAAVAPEAQVAPVVPPGCSLSAIQRAAEAGRNQSTVRLCTAPAARPTCLSTKRMYPWIKQTLRELGVGDAKLSGLNRQGRLKLAHALSLKGFSVTEVYRPARESDDDRLLDTNPHSRVDIELCSDHEITFYVGRWPWRRMPAQDYSGGPLQAATQALAQAGLSPDVQCSNSVALPAGSATLTVARQWPRPGDKLARKLPLQRFDAEEQRPVLFVDCAGAPTVPKVQYIDRWHRGPVEVQVKTDTRWLAPAAAGGMLAALGMTLFRPQPDPGEPAPKGQAAEGKRLRVRVRPDPERPPDVNSTEISS